MIWRIIETRAHPGALPRTHDTEALVWRFARRHGHEVWEVTDNGRSAFERFLGQG